MPGSRRPQHPADGEIARAIDVTRRFGGTGGVQDLTLHVPRGRIVGLVGPSGSGKTTTVRLLLGVDRPEEGELRVFARAPHTHLRRDRRRIGYLPQHRALYGDLSMRHNLQLMASLQGMPSRLPGLPGRRHASARNRIDEVLALLDLQEVQQRRLRDASGGEQRRLALAAAIVHEPDLLVLDEPTSGVDPALRQRLWSHFEDLRATGTTLLVTTQYVGEAAHCDLIVMLVDGQVVAADTPAALRRRAFGPGGDAEASWDDVFVRLLDDHRGPAHEAGGAA